jgi:predicted amidophosphoribosyltransferase
MRNHYRRKRKKCPHCGAPLLSEDKFCHKCLEEIEEEDVEVVIPENY